MWIYNKNLQDGFAITIWNKNKKFTTKNRAPFVHITTVLFLVFFGFFCFFCGLTFCLEIDVDIDLMDTFWLDSKQCLYHQAPFLSFTQLSFHSSLSLVKNFMPLLCCARESPEFPFKNFEKHLYISHADTNKRLKDIDNKKGTFDIKVFDLNNTNIVVWRCENSCNTF